MSSAAAERWVVNASPVILLAKAGVIRLLPQLCAELVVPAVVRTEVERGGMADAGRAWLEAEGRAFLREVPLLPHPVLDRWHGGPGEVAVISWALQNPGFVAVLDDRAARRMAAELGVTVIGSLRVILKAKECGRIPLARPALERLRGAGAYVGDALIDRAIALSGEA